MSIYIARCRTVPLMTAWLYCFGTTRWRRGFGVGLVVGRWLVHHHHQYHYHIRLMNDLSAASITEHKAYTIVSDYKKQIINAKN